MRFSSLKETCSVHTHASEISSASNRNWLCHTPNVWVTWTSTWHGLQLLDPTKRIIVNPPPLTTIQTNQTTVPLQAGWPPSHFLSVQPVPARSIHCMRPAQPGGLGTPSSPLSESRHREYPFSAGHWGPGGCWCSGLWTHTHTWGSQASHPQTCRSHPERKKGWVTTTIRESQREGRKKLMVPGSNPWAWQKEAVLQISMFKLG